MSSTTPFALPPIGSLVLAVLLMAGTACRSGRESLAEGPITFTHPEAPAEITYQQMNNEAYSAYNAVSGGVWQEKEALISELDQQLNAIDLKIEAVEDRAKNAAPAAKQEYAQLVEQMDEERERLVDQYPAVSGATDTTWPEVKAHVAEVIQQVLLAVTDLATTLGP